MQHKDLNTDLGNQYVREFLVGACFQIGDEAHWLRTADANVITVDSVNLKEHTPEFKRQKLPVSILKGFETFRYPKLGYRQTSSELGPIVFSVSTTRSAHRGLRFELLKQTFLPVFNYLGGSGMDGATIQSNASTMKNLFAPKFTPFTQGIAQLLAGEIAGFAVNEQVAVAVSCTRGGEREYDVYFRDRVVGSVSNKGSVTLSNKVLARTDNIRSLLK